MKKNVSGRFAPRSDRKKHWIEKERNLFFGMAKKTLGSADFFR